MCTEQNNRVKYLINTWYCKTNRILFLLVGWSFEVRLSVLIKKKLNWRRTQYFLVSVGRCNSSSGFILYHKCIPVSPWTHKSTAAVQFIGCWAQCSMTCFDCEQQRTSFSGLLFNACSKTACITCYHLSSYTVCPCFPWRSSLHPSPAEQAEFYFTVCWHITVDTAGLLIMPSGCRIFWDVV